MYFAKARIFLNPVKSETRMDDAGSVSSAEIPYFPPIDKIGKGG
jgi:hypothetical protein